MRALVVKEGGLQWPNLVRPVPASHSPPSRGRGCRECGHRAVGRWWNSAQPSLFSYSFNVHQTSCREMVFIALHYNSFPFSTLDYISSPYRVVIDYQ